MFLLCSSLIILAFVLLLPFLSRRVEEKLEVFLLLMGALAVTLTGEWSRALVWRALEEPLKITAAVLVFGVIFRSLRGRLDAIITSLPSRALPWTAVLLVLVLGVLSSVITAIIAALILVEVLNSLKLPRSLEIRLCVIGCFAIGLGAVLTPLGEPLSTIATAQLSGPPHGAGFFFLARLLWPWVLPGILVLAVLAGWKTLRSRNDRGEGSLVEDGPETWMGIAWRTGKTYLFVAALVLLGTGFSPLAELWLVELSPMSLYWVNTVSAVLDNATLAAAEVSPLLDPEQLRFLLLSLLVSGGLLIPGNIPNIVCAGKLGITSREWARAAFAPGLALLLGYFYLLVLLS